MYDALYGEFSNGPSMTMNPCLLRAKSRGSVTLRSANPKDLPIVDHNYFDHPNDIKLMLKG